MYRIRETRDWGTTICWDPSNGDFRTRVPTSLRSYSKELSAERRSFLQIGSNACSVRSSSVAMVATSISAPVGIRSSEVGSIREARPTCVSRSRVGRGPCVRRRSLGVFHFGSDPPSGVKVAVAGRLAIELSLSPLLKSEPSPATGIMLAGGP
jgi:hypothetical protein